MIEIEKIDKKFDLIITYTFKVEHLTDVEIFNKFYEILKPGGD